MRVQIKSLVKHTVIGLVLVGLGYASATWMMDVFGRHGSATPVSQNDGGYAVGQSLPQDAAQKEHASQTSKFALGFSETEWEALLPPDWDPSQVFKNLNVGSLQDGDPKAQQALLAMKQAWKDAPVNMQLDGKKILIPGFAIPLEQSDRGVSELLLVPYFGACIHTPPPPANQIIHVKLSQAEAAIGAMQPYWVWGVLKAQRFQNDLGDSAYRLMAAGLKPYDGE
jgi:hypothetical protein